MSHLIGGLRASAFGAVLGQYYDKGGHVHNDITLAATWTDPSLPPKSVTPRQVKDEVTRVMHAAHWTVNENTVIVLLVAPPTSIGGCGFHTAEGATVSHETAPAIAVVPYTDSGPCDFGMGVSSNATIATSHELAETITDPFNVGFANSGWWNIGGPPLGEAADACSAHSPTSNALQLSDGGWAEVASVYGLDQRKCVDFG